MMPAIVYFDHEDDGVSSYYCSECGEGVAVRGSPELWFHCPWCGVLFTHNEDAHTREALDKRDERRRGAYAPHEKKHRYWFRAWVPNFGIMRYDHGETIDTFFFQHKHPSEPWKLKSGDEAYFAWGDSCYSDLHEQPEPFVFIDYPKQFGRGWLDRGNLVRLIQRYHGCPMWFGIVKGESRDEA